MTPGSDLLAQLSTTVAGLACDPGSLRFTFDETSQSLVDASCNGYAGTAVDAVGGEPGRVGGAFRFDGEGARVEAGDILGFSADEAFSISTWINPDCGVGSGVIASKVQAEGAKRGWMFRFNNKGHLKLVLKHHKNSDRLSVISAEPVRKVVAGGWHMVTATYDGSRAGAGIQLYVDGQPVAMTVEDEGLDGDIEAGADVPFTVGARQGGLSPFAGAIDELLVAGEVLAPEAVAELYASTDALALDGAGRALTLARWTLDDNAGGVVADELGGTQGAATGTEVVVGVQGNALRMDGSSYVTMGDTLGFERGQPFSISAWAKADGTPSKQILVSKQDAETGRGYIVSYDNAGRLRFALRHRNSKNGKAKQVRVLSQEVVGEDWHHVAVTWDGSGKASGVGLFVDGAPIAFDVEKDDLCGTTIPDADFNISGRDNGDRLFEGDVDDVRVFSGALTPLEVLQVRDDEFVDPLDQGTVVLEARKTYGPSTWFDAELTAAEPIHFAMPETVPVTTGNAGNHWLTFTYGSGGNTVSCTYTGGADQSHPSGDVQVTKGL